jgi:serine/threonine-protein kinase
MAEPDLASAAEALGAALAARSDAAEVLGALAQSWQAGAAALGPEAAALGTRFAKLARTSAGAVQLAALGPNARPLVVAWAASVAADPAVFLAPILNSARARPSPRGVSAARARVASGPLRDALGCLGQAGEPEWLAAPGAARTRARLDLLLWEAGAGALVVPELGAWLWQDPAAFELLVRARMRGNLRERVLAARTLALAADGMPESRVSPALEDSTTRAALRLLRHPEPLVWIPAARALGRLVPRLGEVRRALGRYLGDEQAGLRRRAITALGCVPGSVREWVDQQIEHAVAEGDAWSLAALGPALPFFAAERRDLWQWVVSRIMAMEEPEPEVVWSMTQGLAALARRDGLDRLTASLLRAARDRALNERPKDAAAAQLWRTVLGETDFLDGLAEDPAFPDVALDRAVSDALRVGADRVVERARAHARSLGGVYEEALERAQAAADARECGQELASAESALRAAALGLWVPLSAAAARPTDELEATRAGMARLATGLLDGASGPNAFALRRLALRTLGLVIDATSAAQPGQESARGSTMAASLAALTGSAWAGRLAGSREASRYRKPVRDVLGRLGDGTRGEAEGAELPPDVLLWWTLCASGIGLYAATARDPAPMPSLDEVTDALAKGDRHRLIAALALTAPDSALSHVTGMLVDALDAAQRVPEHARPALEFLGEALAQMAHVVRDPVAALAPAAELSARPAAPELVAGSPSEAGRAALVERFARQAGPALEPWVAPVLSELLARVAHAAPPLARQAGSKVGPYRLIRRLGAGGQGQAWLVEKEAGGRAFVMKIPVAPPAGESRGELRESLAHEASLLRRVHSLHVASFVDHGWDGDTPYMVLQYLRGASLEDYVKMRPLTLEEAQPIVADVCIGLRELHVLGIVHRDLKPSNVFLQLALPAGGDRFEPAYREASVAPLAGAVLIDFGIAGLATQSAAFAGTLGFVAPEQVASEPPAYASDVYGLAATVFWALTGRCFFDTEPDPENRWALHGTVTPFEDDVVKKIARELPKKLVKLLSQATALDPAARPDLASFNAAFAAL